MRLVVILVAVAGALAGLMPAAQKEEAEESSAGYALFV